MSQSSVEGAAAGSGALTCSPRNDGPAFSADETRGRLADLPAQPGPLLTLMEAPAGDPDAIVKALEHAPALAGRVLAVTNSANTGLVQPIESLPRAVIHLGASRSKAIALSHALATITDQLPVSDALMDRWWRSALTKAAAARRAADAIDPPAAELAYGRALVQDLGLPLLMALDEPFYEALLAEPASDQWSEREAAHFGLDHAQAGAELLRGWDAPEPLIEATRQHHVVPVRGQTEQALARVPGFVAALLPHAGEPIGPGAWQWLTALHGRFLAGGYAAPDTFLDAAAADAGEAAGRDAKPIAGEALQRRLSQEVAERTGEMVRELCELETTLGLERQKNSRLRNEAFTDPLTLTLNRRGFWHLAHYRLSDAEANRQPICCLALDLDQFKRINDTHGHEVGDAALKSLTAMLRQAVGGPDLIGRLGGDEFAILLTPADREKATAVIERIVDSCSEVDLELGQGQRTTVRLSVGAVLCGPDAPLPALEDLIAGADEAMYQCKRAGGGNWRLHACPSASASSEGASD